MTYLNRLNDEREQLVSQLDFITYEMNSISKCGSFCDIYHIHSSAIIELKLSKNKLYKHLRDINNELVAYCL